MPAVQCSIPGCDYVTDDLDPAIVAALITAHSTTQTMSIYSHKSLMLNNDHGHLQ
jgi:hypothetical protein